MKSRFYIELLAPRQNSATLEADLERFEEKYRRVIELGHNVSLTDNPMGILSFQATELISDLGLPIAADQLLVHLNTFHSKTHLDGVLNAARNLGIKHLLIVSGDGSERLTKLTAESLGLAVNTVTSVELLTYIRNAYPGVFTCGGAFNPYEPRDHELDKLQRKVAAGAKFIITQPIIGPPQQLDALQAFDIDVVIGAWMSKKLELLSDCVGYPISPGTAYDPIANLRELHRYCGHCGLYLSLLGFKTQLPLLDEILK